ncbi:TetR/AcrR family transcriptional regulator [Mycolicibacterium brisbanense]
MSPRGEDWLVGGDRRAHAAERIYAAATELVARDGLDSLDIDAIAARVHCSRATVYRYAGGKSEIRDAVLSRLAARIVEEVRRQVDGLSGADRVLTAIVVALRLIRSDPMADLLMTSLRSGSGGGLTESDAVTGFATELAGLADGDGAAADWIVRVVLSMLFWPGADEASERRMLDRFVAPAFG